jgi:ubiquinone/menaquinone biosynthesis C-methylase UbiE
MTHDNPGLKPNPVEKISDLLACPACGAALKTGADRLTCSGCAASYPRIDGVPMLAMQGSSETWGAAPVGDTSVAYQRQYTEVANAARYNADYRERFTKRLSTRREFALLRRLLGSQGRSRTILDLPCGGGRLSGEIGAHTDLIIEADIAAGQVLHGQRNSRLQTPQVWLTASAFHIPLKDASVDGAVCPRLCHHLPEPAERERLFRELLRVVRRFVVITFFDYHSPKNTLRRMRRPFDRKPPKITMTRAEVAAVAATHGAELVTAPMLSWLGSGHRYALLVKKTA